MIELTKATLLPNCVQCMYRKHINRIWRLPLITCESVWQYYELAQKIAQQWLVSYHTRTPHCMPLDNWHHNYCIISAFTDDPHSWPVWFVGRCYLNNTEYDLSQCRQWYVIPITASQTALDCGQMWNTMDCDILTACHILNCFQFLTKVKYHGHREDFPCFVTFQTTLDCGQMGNVTNFVLDIGQSSTKLVKWVYWMLKFGGGLSANQSAL